MKFLPLMLLFMICCAHNRPVSEVPQTVDVKLTEKDIQECRDYEKKVLVGSHDGDKMIFTKEVGQARKYLSHFDVNKGLSNEKAGLLNAILKNCNEERIQKFDVMYKFVNRCSLMFSELEYFQSLASALKTYRWPTDLKLEGKKVALDYVRYYAEGEFPLVNRLVALSVLDELSVNKVVNEELHPEIKKQMTEARNYVEGLREKLDSDPSLTCNSLSIIQEELKYSLVISKKIKELLTRI